MNLVVDIGNTHTKVAWFDKGEIIENRRTEKQDTSYFTEVLGYRPADKVIVSSVGKNNTRITADLKKKIRNLIILDHETPLPLRIRYRTPETLGRDRIAGCAGALCLFPGSNVLVIDMGTAITIDFINAEGEYLGGNISPGMQTRFRALHAFTAKLPLIKHDSDFPRFGTDTRTAIAAGVQQGILFELNGYMDDYAVKYPGCKFIVTGGDAGYFVREFKRDIQALPDLVLTGLNFILEFNVSLGRL